MSELLNKNILLGITGGIAAYKSAELCRLLIRQGAHIKVVMTPGACEFIQPLTFQALSGHQVYVDLFDAGANNAMDHIELARWSDLLLIAPASADFLAKLSQGYADNLLLTVALASQNTIAVAPAMNQQMYQDQATQQNLQLLNQRGVLIWGPDEGEQACGEIGPGRMLEPEVLSRHTVDFFKPGQLTGKHVMITAGPTREAIDPVRFISNRSSGKMGYELARAARDSGATVTLVSGPVCLQPPSQVNLLKCQSAEEMLNQVMSVITEQDIFIASAAVADYRPHQIADQKIKKTDETLTLPLVKNPDILSTVAHLYPRPFCVGFAAETTDLELNARNKLENKKLDLIAANWVNDEKSGFDVDDNALSVIWPGGMQELPHQPKSLIAEQLIDIIAKRFLLVE
ncbi:MAG: bifunctional phosphopantothenoylcysteine decarboxylase/phosphopantothenate--cysteine ligase CoaBC [Gammaproteobacteria bacterium]|nr:bifunctional phosphopantothenoylcysteine decarboxylase/phosphopantothenate--cysteine ligase CoaBC [Gammaproteobacteria bacterium]